MQGLTAAGATVTDTYVAFRTPGTDVSKHRHVAGCWETWRWLQAPAQVKRRVFRRPAACGHPAPALCLPGGRGHRPGDVLVLSSRLC